MDDIQWTTAYLLTVLGPWGPVHTGQLTLSDGVLKLERRGTRDPLFSVPVGEVQARFPKLYFGLGLKLIVGRKRYRIWFVPLHWVPGGVGSSRGGRGFYWSEAGPARAATQKWRTTLSGTGT
jgi:hypothetical protein